MNDRFRLLYAPDGDAGAAGATGDAGAPADKGAAPSQDEGIRLSKADYEALIQAKTERENLRKEVEGARTSYKRALGVLSPTADPAASLEDTKAILKEAGYTPDQVRQYEETVLKPQAPAGDKGKPKGKARDDGPMEGDDDTLSEMKKDLEDLKRQKAEDRYAYLTGQLKTSSRNSLDKNKDLGTLIDKLVSLHPDEDGKADERKEQVSQTLLGEIEREAQDRLRERRTKMRGAWDDGWIKEEAEAAAKAVYGKYKSMVGDVSRLGPSSDSVGAEDLFLKQKPVPEPVYKRGIKPADLDKQVGDWAQDQLLRAAATAGTKGATRV